VEPTSQHSIDIEQVTKSSKRLPRKVAGVGLAKRSSSRPLCFIVYVTVCHSYYISFLSHPAWLQQHSVLHQSFFLLVNTTIPDLIILKFILWTMNLKK
jgi:hypothetical protein